MKCPECQTEVTEQMEICPECGYPLAEEESNYDQSSAPCENDQLSTTKAEASDEPEFESPLTSKPKQKSEISESSDCIDPPDKRPILGLKTLVLVCVGTLLGITAILIFDNFIIKQFKDLPKECSHPPNEESIVDDMILIPAGEFWMGTDDNDIQLTRQYDEAAKYDFELVFGGEEPKNKIYLDAFSIDRHEVTVGEYSNCVCNGSCSMPKDVAYNKFCNWGSSRGNDHPINCVKWEQAEEYCRWKNKRLPTEAEWEKAARGSDGRLYPWGNQKPSCDIVIWDDDPLDGAKRVACGRPSTWPVCSKPSGNSPYDLCDMSGNVSEWVDDYYDKDYYRNTPSRNPDGPIYGSQKVLRGGSWDCQFPSFLRTASRDPLNPTVPGHSNGFRCAKSSQ